MKREVITVKRLLGQLREKSRIELPAGALITPAAAEWLRTSRTPIVRRDEEAADDNHTGDRDPGTGQYLVGDRHDLRIQTLRAQLERRLDAFEFISCEGQRGRLIECLGQVCGRLAENAGSRAVIVLGTGAVATCLANKQRGVRAAIGARPSALWSLVNDLGINLLVLEGERLSFRQILAMSERFFDLRSAIDPLVEEAIRRVEERAGRPAETPVDSAASSREAAGACGGGGCGCAGEGRS